MNAFQAFTLITGLASIAGLIYAVYYGVKSKRTKILAYQSTAPIPLATALSPEEDYKLTVLFRRPDSPDELVDCAHVRFLRFANFGKEPIRRNDIAPANPLAIVVEGARVLDLTLTGGSRDVIRLDVSDIKLDERKSEAKITFDFLDYQDGGTLKILTVEDAGSAYLSGDIIGMPRGIMRTDQIRRLSWLSKLGWILGALVQISAFGATALVFRRVTDSWHNWWLLLLPVLALFVPAIIIAIVAGTIWPTGEPRLPATLGLPKWFIDLTNLHSARPPSFGDFVAEQETNGEDEPVKP